MCAGSLSKALLGTVLCLLCSHLTALQASGWAPSPSKGWWKKKKRNSLSLDRLSDGVNTCVRWAEKLWRPHGARGDWSRGPGVPGGNRRGSCSKKLCRDSQRMLTDQLGIPSPFLTSTQVLSFQKLLTKRTWSVNFSLPLLKYLDSTIFTGWISEETGKIARPHTLSGRREVAVESLISASLWSRAPGLLEIRP